MNNTILALEVLGKIASNFIFNPVAISILVFFALGLGTWAWVSKLNKSC